MLKSTVFFVVVFTFQVIHSNDKLTPNIYNVQHRLNTTTDRTISLLQNIHSEDEITSVARLYASSLQEVAHFLERILSNNAELSPAIFLSAQHFTRFANHIEEVARTYLFDLRNTFKNTLLDVRKEAQTILQNGDELLRFAQREDKYNIDMDIQRVVNEILDVTQRLNFHAQLRQQTQEQTRQSIVQLIYDITNAVESININKGGVVEKLIRAVQQYSDFFTHLVPQLEHSAPSTPGEARSVITQVVNNLKDIQVPLDDAAKIGYGNIQVRGNQLKNQIKINIQNASAQTQKLLQLIEGGNHGQQDYYALKTAVIHFVANFLANEYDLLRQLERLVG